MKAGEMLYGEKLARIHRTTAEEEAAAFAYLTKHDDKEYSAVDCLSFVVMEKLGSTKPWPSTATSATGSS